MNINIYTGFKELAENGWTKEQLDALDEHCRKIDDESKYECCDNFRFARVDNQKEVNAYYDAKNHGCCGFYDVEFSGIMFGFNYGH